MTTRGTGMVITMTTTTTTMITVTVMYSPLRRQ